MMAPWPSSPSNDRRKLAQVAPLWRSHLRELNNVSVYRERNSREAMAGQPLAADGMVAERCSCWDRDALVGKLAVGVGGHRTHQRPAAAARRAVEDQLHSL